MKIKREVTSDMKQMTNILTFVARQDVARLAMMARYNGGLPDSHAFGIMGKL